MQKSSPASGQWLDIAGGASWLRPAYLQRETRLRGVHPRAYLPWFSVHMGRLLAVLLRHPLRESVLGWVECSQSLLKGYSQSYNGDTGHTTVSRTQDSPDTSHHAHSVLVDPPAEHTSAGPEEIGAGPESGSWITTPSLWVSLELDFFI